jgi:ubiquinone/menaquinone biosynthesis C-methylase UbiE
VAAEPDLDTAYALETPEDNRALYAGWAKTYDTGFAEKMDFRMPSRVARLFHDRGGVGPVLDAGAGTGLVAAEILRQGPCDIDAIDLTQEMLDVASGKGLYRRTIQGDLTRTLPFEDGSYRAVVSSGTFTHGHVGSDAFDELLRVAMAGALFVLTIKSDIFETHGFRAKFDALSARISNVTFLKEPI